MKSQRGTRPGEQLPRWALNCFWRKDGEPIWLDPGLCADERRHYGADAALAAELALADPQPERTPPL